MLGFVTKGLVALLLLALGWGAGSLYPAPQQWVEAVRGRADPIIAQLDISPSGLTALRQRLSPQRFSRLSQEAAALAASTGDAIRVERGRSDILDEHVDQVMAERQRLASTPRGGDAFENTLRLCPGMTVSNAPAADDQNNVADYAKLVRVNGDTLAVNPTRGACLASGVGRRSGRMHKGLDFYSRDGGPVFAAADGVVVEQLYRDDYGNMLLIDHGGGVFTRYAHLSSFAPSLAIGARVTTGQQIGLMGNTAGYSIPVHLHYEVLVGNYNTPQRSFGLTPRSPFDFPAADGAPETAVAAADHVQAERTLPSQLIRGETQGAFCPSGPITEATTITIRRGDRLSSIARACYGDAEAWRKIADCNSFLLERNRGGASPLNGGDLLYIGDRIALPTPDGQCPA